MATKAKQGHSRVDSAMNGITSMSETLTKAQSIHDAISSFALESGFRALSELVDEIPRLEKGIKEKDDIIGKLHNEMTAGELEQAFYNQKQLKVFQDKYDEWKKEKSDLHSMVKDLQEISQEKGTEISTLEKQLKDRAIRVEELEAENDKISKMLERRDLEIADLETKLEDVQVNVDDLSEELRESQDRVATLETSQNEREVKHQKLKEESTKTRDKLKELIQFSVKHKELDLPDVANRLEDWWKSAALLVESFIGKDLPEEILQSDWGKLRENATIEHQIPLPQSNSGIAKLMRVAATVGFLARLVDKFIFQPTYVLHEDSGFRELLCRQATINQRKERFTRGIILSMFPEDQEKNSEDSINFVIEELFNGIDVRIFFGPDNLALFQERLKGLLSQVQESWKTVQQGKQKLEPIFTYSTPGNYPWRLFDMYVADGKDGRGPRTPLVTDSVEDDVVIFPRLYLMEAEAEPSPITHGAVLRKAQLNAATEEVRRSISSAPFAQPTLSRHRRPTRGMSMTGDSARSGRRDERFLV